MQNVRKILAGCSVLLMAVMAACADQPVSPRAAADGVQPAANSAEPVAVSISGPPKVISTGTYMWQTYATGGDGTYTYIWERRAQGSGTWTYVGSGTIYYGAVGSEPSFELRVTAYSGGLAGSHTYAVTVALLSAAISGPSSVSAGTSATWNGSSSGGFDSVMYEWYYRPANSSTWTYVAYGSTYTRYIATSSPTAFYLRLKVSSGHATTEAYHYVQVSGSTGGGGGGGGGGCPTCPLEN